MVNRTINFFRLKGRLKEYGIAVLALLITTCLVGWLKFLHTPLTRDQGDEFFTVKPGETLSQISDQLTDNGLVPYSLVATLYARLHGLERSIQEGEYLLDSETTLASLITKMANGEKYQHKVTFLEGWKVSQVLAELWSRDSIMREIYDDDPKVIANLLGLDTDNAEGMVFPDTYFFTRNTSDISLLKRANQKLTSVLTKAWGSRAEELPLNNAYEALILASVIEKESGLNSERSKISGVFLRRMELGMRLQSDPTVIYGMGSKYRGNISREDLLESTPYNTYRIDGLPPTPISLAGEASIKASLNPTASSFLYFVSRGDGSHYFSENLREHNAAVARYQKRTTSRDSTQ